MVPKYRKSAAEKRHDRGSNSPWAKTGSKKVARIDRLYKSKYSLLPTTIQQFITAHNIPHDDVLALLSEHYKNDAPRPHPEVVLDTSKQVFSGTADGHGQSSSSSDQPMERACEDPLRDAPPAIPTAVVPPQPSVLPTETDQAPVPVLLPNGDTGANPSPSKVRRVASPSPHQVNTRHGVSGSHPNASPPPQPPLPPDGFDSPNGPLSPRLDGICQFEI